MEGHFSTGLSPQWAVVSIEEEEEEEQQQQQQKQEQEQVVVSTSPNPKLEDHPLLALRECFSNIFAVVLHIWRPFSIQI